jgi:hypothetical protein
VKAYGQRQSLLMKFLPSHLFLYLRAILVGSPDAQTSAVLVNLAALYSGEDQLFLLGISTPMCRLHYNVANRTQL